MELALYCPDYGFYETETDKVGREGDFFTSVSVGSVFGELLAIQFSDWLRDTQTKSREGRGRLHLIEAGANDGRLALDILSWFSRWRPEQFAELDYWIVEPSLRLQRRQQSTLARFGGQVRIVGDMNAVMENGRVNGVIFSNELLDAMPVRRMGWDSHARQWFEWGVRLDEAEQFAWTRMPCATPIETQGLPEELLNVLPHEYTFEICPQAIAWWREAATWLESGRLVAIDYGLTQDELWAPHRLHGTLRTYSRHQIGGDLLRHPGELDITAHVNFPAIEAAGLACGLRTITFCSQEKFLVDITRRLADGKIELDFSDAKRRRQFQTLIHPHHMGRPFRVLVQARGD
jgi:SAM-dependent MidA family methyltransferase